MLAEESGGRPGDEEPRAPMPVHGVYGFMTPYAEAMRGNVPWLSDDTLYDAAFDNRRQAHLRIS